MVDVAELDRIGLSGAIDVLRPCCASHRWIGEMVSGRPHGSLQRLIAASDEALTQLGWTDIAEALAAHPRIGERLGGADRESAWSREEQAAAGDPSGALLADELIAGNIAYERRFGHVFLICSTGRDAAEVLAALRARLANPTDAERRVVRGELRAIVRLRLIKTFCDRSGVATHR